MAQHEGPFADPVEPHVIQPSPDALAARPVGKRGASAAGTAVDGTGQSDNVVDLMKQLAMQGSHLAEQQLALIKAEVRESTGELKGSVGAIAGAAVVGMAGLGVTLMGVAFLLGDAIDNTGLATLIVGLVTLGIAAFLYGAGAKKMRATHLSPERTQRTLQRTPDAVRGDLNTEHTR